MKKEFSTAWIASKQPRKQRKYLVKAPLHIKKKMISANLSKELRKSVGKRSAPLKKDDEVKVMRGKFKGKTGKVLRVMLKMQKIEVEGVQAKKIDGSRVNIKIMPSNVQIVQMSERGKKGKGSAKKTEEKPKAEEKVKTEKSAENKGTKKTINKKTANTTRLGVAELKKTEGGKQ